MNEAQLSLFKRDQIRSRIDLRVGAHQKGYRQNLGLIGSEGLGKTHLLSEVYSDYAKQSEWITIYLDLRTLDFDHLIDRWVTNLLTSASQHQGFKVSSNFQILIKTAEAFLPNTVQKIRHLKKMIRKGEKHTATVRELFSLTSTLTQETGKKVILILDEFHELNRLPVPDPFAILGKEMMVEKDTLYLVASSKPDQARDIFHHKLSLLFGNFEVIELAPLGFDEVVQFISQRWPQVHLTHFQKKVLIRMTDGIPVYLELLMEQLHQRVKQHSTEDIISDKDVLNVFHRELIDHRGRISWMFESRLARCRRLAKDAAPYVKTLLAISSGRRKALGISTFIEKKTQETKKILLRLV